MMVITGCNGLLDRYIGSIGYLDHWEQWIVGPVDR